MLPSPGAQPLLSALQAPDGQAILTESLQLPLPSQVGVTSVSLGHDAVPQTVPAG